MSINTRSAATMQMVRGFNETQRQFGQISGRISSGQAKQTTTGIILGESLRSRASICETVNRGISYTMNMLNVASSSVSGISELAEKALALSVEAGGGKSQAQIDALNVSFQDLIKQIKDGVTRAKFDGKELLNGSLSGNPTIQKKYSTSAVSIKSAPVVVGTAGFAGAEGVGATATITIGNAMAPGDTINFARYNQIFTFVANDSDAENEVKIGVNQNETAQNLITKILNHSNEGLKHYELSIAANVITVTNISASVGALTNIVGGAANHAAVALGGAPAQAPAISLSGVRNVSEFIGNIANPFALLGAAGTSQATTLTAFQSAQNAVVAGGNLGAGADRGVALTCTIGKTIFTGGVFVAAAGNANNYKMRMSAEDGQYFDVNFGATFADISAGGGVGESAALITRLNNLFAGTTFSQTCYLNLDKDGKDIILQPGGAIGSTKNMTASLKTTDFKDLKMEKFDITTTGANSTFAATINGKVYNSGPVATNSLVKGFKLTLIGSDPFDVLSINLGDRGLIAMTTQERSVAVAEAFSKAFGLGKAIELRTGESLDDKSSISIESLAASRLFVDNDGVSNEKINIATEGDRKKAEEIIGNLQKTVSRVKTYINNQIDSLQRISESLSNSMTVQAAAASGYLDTNYQEATQELADVLSRNYAIVASLLKQSKIEENVRQLLMQG